MSERMCECGCGLPTQRAAKTSARAGYRKGDPMRFLPGHQRRANMRAANAARLMRLPSEWIEEDRGFETPCWIWQRATNADGYGIRRPRDGESQLAYRWIYERDVALVPEGLELDHLCRIRACVNPAHLEPVTKRENILRGEGMGARWARRTAARGAMP